MGSIETDRAARKGVRMILNIPRDYDVPLKQQVKQYTDKGYTYIGCFGRTGNAILKFVEGR